MGKNMPNINPMSIVVYGSNQTGVIAANIKNRYCRHKSRLETVFSRTLKIDPQLCGSCPQVENQFCHGKPSRQASDELANLKQIQKNC
jgi:hypothetical protein